MALQSFPNAVLDSACNAPFEGLPARCIIISYKKNIQRLTITLISLNCWPWIRKWGGTAVASNPGKPFHILHYPLLTQKQQNLVTMLLFKEELLMEINNHVVRAGLFVQTKSKVVVFKKNRVKEIKFLQFKVKMF